MLCGTVELYVRGVWCVVCGAVCDYACVCVCCSASRGLQWCAMVRYVSASCTGRTVESSKESNIAGVSSATHSMYCGPAGSECAARFTLSRASTALAATPYIRSLPLRPMTVETMQEWTVEKQRVLYPVTPIGSLYCATRGCALEHAVLMSCPGPHALLASTMR